MFGLTMAHTTWTLIYIPHVSFCVHSNKPFCGQSLQASLNFKQSYICNSLLESTGCVLYFYFCSTKSLNSMDKFANYCQLYRGCINSSHTLGCWSIFWNFIATNSPQLSNNNNNDSHILKLRIFLIPIFPFERFKF